MGIIFAIFLAAASALVALVGKMRLETLQNADAPSMLDQFIFQGGMNYATVILLAILWTGFYLAYIWLRHAYYVGSYLITFHEEGNPTLQWLTRNRTAENAHLQKVRTSYSRSFFRSTWILFLFAITPFFIGIYKIYNEMFPSNTVSSLNLSWTLSFGLVVIFFVFALWRAIKLGRISREQKAITEGWEREKQKIEDGKKE